MTTPSATPDAVSSGFLDSLRARGFRVTTGVSLLAIYIIVCTIFSLLSPYFLTVDNFINIGRTLPVIGIPLPSSPLQGLDSLLSTVQMPAGVPVATMALGSTGARNAALFAAQILALSDPLLQEKIKQHKLELEAKVVEQNDQIPPNYRAKI